MRGAHIGVDATCWRNARGYGRHARALLGRLLAIDGKHDYTLVVDSPECIETLPEQARALVVAAAVPAALAASATGRRSFRDMWRMSRALSRGGFDALLFPTVYSFVPVATRARKIVFIHDVIPERYPNLAFSSGLTRAFWRAKVAAGRWQADAIVTVSEYSRRGIVEHFGVAPDRVFVVSEASDPIFRVRAETHDDEVLEAAGIPGAGRLLVYVGGFGAHKNLGQLVESFATVTRRDRFSDVRLVLVGEYRSEVFNSNYENLRARIDELAIADKVVFTGFLPDEALVGLLNRATALVLPSLIEGFGLPAIEAAACGCPVVATTESPLPELLGEGGIYFDPRDSGALQDGIMTILDSETIAARMRGAALEAAGRLSWDDAARQLMNVIERVVAR
jgi:glycosyltransferase involved in cell wall biosynthesis